MRFLLSVRVKVLGVFLALTACLALIGFFGCSKAFTTPQEQKANTVFFLNDRVRDIIGATAVNAAGFIMPGGLTGEGQIIAIADSGLDTGRLEDMHPDLKNTPGKTPKIISLESVAGRKVPDDPDGHGTHMAATIAGTGVASNGQFRGVAPEASLYFQAILNADGKPELPEDFNDLFGPAYSAGARVHVDGWGSGTNTYGESSAEIDGFVRSHPDFLIIFGAGNSGPSSGTITTEANNKNALSVGASILPRPAFVPGSDNTTLPADFSSRGPSADGRIKPELLAPASAVISAKSSLVEGNLPGYPEYTRMQGTSMAAAVAGGASALLREYFNERMKISLPSAALIKAALINGAHPTGGGPSKEGYGIIDLAATVIALREGTFKLTDEQAGVSQGKEISYTFFVDDTTEPFKATLAWTDPPAESGSKDTLVNDIDMEVQAPDGTIYYGNNFLGTGAPDRTNNVEQVYLPSPALGEYTIRVTGARIKQNTVQEELLPSQDFALVWGQAPAEGIVEKTAGDSFTLEDGSSIDLGDVSAKSLVNDTVAAVDAAHIYTGSAVYQTSRKIYLVARLWQATGVRLLNTVVGRVFTEINPAAKLGGYSLAAEVGEFKLNGQPVKNPYEPGGLPPGIEINAVINPLDQKIRQVGAAYSEQEGVISAIHDVHGQRLIYLEGGSKVYKVSGDAVYSYEDSYIDSNIADIPFGTGALDELDKVLTGMNVRLRIAPSSGEVQYIAVKRQVVLGTVRETDASAGKIIMENGASYQLLQGTPVIRDRENSSIGMIKPGDNVTAVLLPDKSRIIGLVAYSNILYGKAIDVSRKDRTLYLLGNDGYYSSFYLPPDAVFYNFGANVTADAISTGNLVKVAINPRNKEVCQVDIADVFTAQGVVAGYDPAAGILTTVEGQQFHAVGQTRFYKDNFPVQPEDIMPGEQIEIEYTAAPQSAGNLLVSANVESTAPGPLFLASVLPIQDRLVVTGRTGVNTMVYIWEKGSVKQTVPVDKSGRFYYSRQRNDGEDYNFTVMAIDRQTGGIAGMQVSLPGSVGVTDAQSAVSPGGGNLTRAGAAMILARLLNWSSTSSWQLPLVDTGELPVISQTAIAEGWARGILKGYPDGSFLPENSLSRAEAAVIMAGVLHDLGLQAVSDETMPYSDAADIPAWAVNAVAETTAAGLFHGCPEGAFKPAEPCTISDLVVVLNRLQDFCQGKEFKFR